MSTYDTRLALANTILDVEDYCNTNSDVANTLDDALTHLIDNGGIFDLPAIAFGAKQASPLSEVKRKQIRALARVFVDALKRAGYDLSGTLETTEYVETPFGTGMTRTRKQISINPAYTSFTETRQSVFVERNGRRF
jgi:anaerobic glycerol-3-phosphate dehydrogenase